MRRGSAIDGSEPCYPWEAMTPTEIVAILVELIDGLPPAERQDRVEWVLEVLGRNEDDALFVAIRAELTRAGITRAQ